MKPCLLLYVSFCIFVSLVCVWRSCSAPLIPETQLSFSPTVPFSSTLSTLAHLPGTKRNNQKSPDVLMLQKRITFIVQDVVYTCMLVFLLPRTLYENIINSKLKSKCMTIRNKCTQDGYSWIDIIYVIKILLFQTTYVVFSYLGPGQVKR